MRIILQKANNASVHLPEKSKSHRIGKGYVLLVGIAPEDNTDDINWLIRKVLNLRLFEDTSIQTITGDILIISQFTLFASTKKGSRPSYSKAAPPQVAKEIYNGFVKTFKQMYPNGNIQTGEFGAHMEVTLTNDGPITLLLDSQNRE